MSADAIKLLKPKVFDKSKWMQLPRDVVIGLDVIGQIPSVCEDLKLGKSALLISGKSTMLLAGDTIWETLGENYSVRPFIAEEISMPVIRKAQKTAAGMDFVIGVGGGLVIDTAKIVSYNLDIPFISVPTAASLDGIASSRASVPTVEGLASLDAQPPMESTLRRCWVLFRNPRFRLNNPRQPIAHLRTMPWRNSCRKSWPTQRIPGTPSSERWARSTRSRNWCCLPARRPPPAAPGMRPWALSTARWTARSISTSLSTATSRSASMPRANSPKPTSSLMKSVIMCSTCSASADKVRAAQQRAGSKAQVLMPLGGNRVRATLPRILPGGELILLTTVTAGKREVSTWSLRTRKLNPLVDGDNATYVPETGCAPAPPSGRSPR